MRLAHARPLVLTTLHTGIPIGLPFAASLLRSVRGRVHRTVYFRRMLVTTLAERAVLVTGANRGMGREYVRQLLDRGVTTVYAAARDPRSVDVLDPRVVPVALDVTDPASVAAAAKAAPDVSVLINNAGIARGASVLTPDTAAVARGTGNQPVRSAGDGRCIRRRDRRAGRGHRQRVLGPGLAAGRSQLRGVQSRPVECDRLDAHRTGVPRCSGGGRLRRTRRHGHGVVRPTHRSPIPPTWCARFSTASSPARRRSWPTR